MELMRKIILISLFISCEGICCENDLSAPNIIQFAKQIDDICKTVAYSPCSASKNSFLPDEVKKIANLLWSNPLLRNKNPGGACFQRASLISKLLDENGFKSEKIILKNNIFAPDKTPEGYRAIRYDVHIANVITVEKSLGNFSKYVLDPMFSDEPMPIEKYIEMVSITNADQPTSVKIVSQTYEADKTSFEFDPIPESIKSCQYNSIIIEENKTKLQEILKDQEVRAHVSFESWDQAKLAYQFFYGIKFKNQPKMSESQREDAIRTANNLPLITRESTRERIKSMLESQP